MRHLITGLPSNVVCDEMYSFLIGTSIAFGVRRCRVFWFVCLSSIIGHKGGCSPFKILLRTDLLCTHANMHTKHPPKVVIELHTKRRKDRRGRAPRGSTQPQKSSRHRGGRQSTSRPQVWGRAPISKNSKQSGKNETRRFQHLDLLLHPICGPLLLSQTGKPASSRCMPCSRHFCACCALYLCLFCRVLCLFTS